MTADAVATGSTPIVLDGVRHVVFDLDGTLLDSDEALIAPFVALGVPREEITFGHVLTEECRRLGIDEHAYLDTYDPTVVQPFAGVEEMLAGLGTWSACSNKVGRAARTELARLGWSPRVAFFTEDFAGPKRLDPVLEALRLGAHEVLYVGDTGHDRTCAQAVGAPFALAGWNPRAEPAPTDLVLTRPADLLTLLPGLAP